MKIENTPVVYTEWQPGKGIVEIAESTGPQHLTLKSLFVEMREALDMLNDRNDREDARKTVNHSDPFAVDCPAVAEMRWA